MFFPQHNLETLFSFFRRHTLFVAITPWSRFLSYLTILSPGHHQFVPYIYGFVFISINRFFKHDIRVLNCFFPLIPNVIEYFDMSLVICICLLVNCLVISFTYLPIGSHQFLKLICVNVYIIKYYSCACCIYCTFSPVDCLILFKYISSMFYKSEAIYFFICELFQYY